MRIRFREATEGLGIAGQTGTVYGRTTPSVTGVEVIGKSSEDLASVVGKSAFWTFHAAPFSIAHLPTNFATEPGFLRWATELAARIFPRAVAAATRTSGLGSRSGSLASWVAPSLSGNNL